MANYVTGVSFVYSALLNATLTRGLCFLHYESSESLRWLFARITNCVAETFPRGLMRKFVSNVLLERVLENTDILAFWAQRCH